MAGVLEVLVVKGSELWPRELHDRLSPVVPLAQGYALVPLTEDLRSRLDAEAGPSLMGFERLTRGVTEAAADASRFGDVVYIHQEFHGGTGFDAAVSWRDGAVVFGPRFTANHPNEFLTDEYDLAEERSRTATNEALRSAGVHSPDGDEFAAVGLDQRRWTDDWAEGA